jgi:hypothetical protein
MSINDEVRKIVAQDKPIYEMGDILQDSITGIEGIVIGIIQELGATPLYLLGCVNEEDVLDTIKLPEGRLIKVEKV